MTQERTRGIGREGKGKNGKMDVSSEMHDGHTAYIQRTADSGCVQ